MAKTITEGKVTTRKAREGLPVGLHWRGIDADVHLGYRKGKRGGVWLVRWYVGQGRYRQEGIGTADDVIKAGNLDYDAAARKARNTVEDRRRDAVAEAAGPVLTIRNAINEYIVDRDARELARHGRPVKSSAHRLKIYVLNDDQFASLPLYKLTKDRLANWRKGVPGALASRRRVTNDFRAALNAATSDGATRLVIAEGLKTPSVEVATPKARDNQILEDGQIVKLLAAARDHDDDDLYRLLLTMAATGARFAQIRRMHVRDVQPISGRLMVPASHKGRASLVEKPPVAVRVGADVIEALQPATEGRKPDVPLFEHWLHYQTGRDPETGRVIWERRGRGPWKTASELTRAFNIIASKAGLAGTIPYALRHSSIVRQLRQGLPVSLVAKNHDTSAAMIEAHYGRWIADALEELTARAIIPLVAEPA